LPAAGCKPHTRSAPRRRRARMPASRSAVGGIRGAPTNQLKHAGPRPASSWGARGGAGAGPRGGPRSEHVPRARKPLPGCEGEPVQQRRARSASPLHALPLHCQRACAKAARQGLAARVAPGPGPGPPASSISPPWTPPPPPAARRARPTHPAAASLACTNPAAASPAAPAGPGLPAGGRDGLWHAAQEPAPADEGGSAPGWVAGAPASPRGAPGSNAAARS